MASKKPTRQTKDPVTHRFQTTLSRALVELLVKTHGEGRDFRNVTAVRCQVHPKLLTRWLSEGAKDPDAGLKTELFMRMAQAEGDYRAELIGEVGNPISMTETMTFEDGKPASKVTEARRTTGLQWLLERRFHQFRANAMPKADDLEICAMLEPQAGAEMNLEQALQIVTMIANNPQRLPPALLQVFSVAGWTVPAKAMTDGQDSNQTAH